MDIKTFLLKRKTFIFWGLLILGYVFLIVALFMPLAPGITCTHTGKTRSYGPAFAFIFGKSPSWNGTEYNENGLTVFGLIGYILLMVATLVNFSCILLKIEYPKFSKILFYSSCLLILVSGVLFFFTKGECAHIIAKDLYITPSDTMMTNVLNKSYIGVGFLLTSIFSLVSFFFYLLAFLWELLVLNKKKEVKKEESIKPEVDYSSTLNDKM